MDGTDARKCDVMDRRGFLAKGAVGGAIVVGGGLLTGVGSVFAAPKPQYLGYRVGDKAADFNGYDQYMRNGKLSDNLGFWTLVDLCPWWCLPCQVAASQHHDLIGYINGKGIPFRIQPVVVENEQSAASVAQDAERWATTWRIDASTVLQDNGDPASPLRQLISTYAAANGNAAPGYPTTVLVDPTGVIRDYRATDDLNEVQAVLAGLTGKTLDRVWTTNTANRIVVSWASAASSFKLWDGTPVGDSGVFQLQSDQSYLFDGPHASFSYSGTGAAVTINLWDVLGDSFTQANPTEDPSKLIDLHSPITLTLTPTAPLDFVPSATVFFKEKDPDGYGFPEPLPTGNTAAPVTINQNGSLTVGPFTPSDSFGNGTWVGSSDTERASNVMVVQLEPGILLYQGSIDLENSVNADSSIANKTKQTASSLLEGARGKLSSRDFSGAATQFSKAAAALASNAGYAGTAQQLANRANWIATH